MMGAIMVGLVFNLVVGCFEDLRRFMAIFQSYRDLEAGDKRSLKS